MMLAKKLHLVKEKLKKMKEEHYSVMVSLQLTQRELEWMRKDLRRRML